MEEINKLSGGVATKPRLWVTRGIGLVSPNIKNGVLIAGMVIIEEKVSSMIRVRDVDTKEYHQIKIPPVSPGMCLLNVEWEQ